jgi:murein L,D-transpeptidase YcbB/YkuD
MGPGRQDLEMAAMQRARFGMIAGTALALTASSAVAQLAPMPAPGYIAQPNARTISIPGSMPKPSTMVGPSEDGPRFRNPASATVPPRREPAPPPAAAPSQQSAPTQQAAPAPRAAPQPTQSPAAVSAPATAPATTAPAKTAAPSPAAAPIAPATATPAAAARAPAPAAAVPAIAVDDVAVAGRLRELIAGRAFERLVARKTDREAIAALYQKSRDFQPLWVGPGAPNDRAKAAIAHLRGVAADGLDPADYPVPNFAGPGADALAEAELKLTAALLSYARHALNGRVHFSRVSPNIEYKLAFDENDVLGRIAASDDLARTLDQFNPQQPAYQALKRKLAEFRGQQAAAGPAPIATGAVLRYGRDRRGREFIPSDPRVPQLRERLGLAAEPGMGYDRSLAAAVAKFQKSRGLQPSGQLNNATVEALNGPSREKQMGAILATMERWRWMPRELGRTHVVLNIPDYHLRVFNSGAQVWMTRVVVGKPSQATPLLTETMKYITVNPTWNVPQSIIYNELLPIYETTDRNIFDRMGLKIEYGRDGVRVYQPPGERNALGRIRFNFPNKFLVYQHDTPERHYFAHERRAYSHGCMRVQDPLKYAEVLLSYAAPRTGLSQASLQRMIGGKEQQIDFQQQIPVHITYQTAFVDDAGKLQFRDDVYGLDGALLSQLKGSERAMADLAIERPADPNFKPKPEDHRRLQSAARGVPNPFAVFEQLFR